MKDHQIKRAYYEFLLAGKFDVIRRVGTFRCERIREHDGHYRLAPAPHADETIEAYEAIVNGPKERLERFSRERLWPCAHVNVRRAYAECGLTVTEVEASANEWLFQQQAAYDRKFPGGASDGANDKDIREDTGALTSILWHRLKAYYTKTRRMISSIRIWLGLQPVLLLAGINLLPYADTLNVPLTETGLRLIDAVTITALVVQAGYTAFTAYRTVSNHEKIFNPLVRTTISEMQALSRDVHERVAGLSLLMEQMLIRAWRAHNQAHSDPENPKSWIDEMIVWIDLSRHADERMNALEDYYTDHDWLRRIVIEGLAAQAQYQHRYFNLWTFGSVSKVWRTVFSLFVFVIMAAFTATRPEVLAQLGHWPGGVLAILIPLYLLVATFGGQWIKDKLANALPTDFADQVSKAAGTGRDGEPPEAPLPTDGGGPPLPGRNNRHHKLRNELDRQLAEWLHKRETSYRA